MRKGHKSGCKCVACCPATRKRGFAALQKLNVKKTSKVRLPKNLKRLLKKRLTSQKTKTQFARILIGIGKDNGWKLPDEIKKKILSRTKPSAHRPTKRFRKIVAALQRRRMVVKRHHAQRRVVVRRHKNPVKMIGSNVAVWVSGHGEIAMPKSRIVCGPGVHSVSIFSQGSHHLPFGGKVSRIDYDNRSKAIRAYHRPGRFKHDFKTHVRIESIRWTKTGTVVQLRGSSPLWKED